MPDNIRASRLGFLFCVILTAFGSVHATTPEFYAQIGSGIAGRMVYRTLFRIANESPQPASGRLEFYSFDGSALDCRLETRWIPPQVPPSDSEEPPGKVDIDGNVIRFDVPSTATLELILTPTLTPTIGWARMERGEQLSVQSLLQIATGISSEQGPGDPINPAAETSHFFEDGLNREVENHPVTSLKSFSFPFLLWRGEKHLKTAFALVNLAAKEVSVDLVQRSGETKSVTLLPREIFSAYIDQVWPGPYIEIFPLRVDTTVEVKSAAPLAVGVYRTFQGVPLSGVALAPIQGEEAAISAELDQPFELAFNQTAAIESENLEVTFWNLEEDSRCPTDVVCVWEGRAVVSVRVRSGGELLGEARLSSLSGDEEASTATFGMYTVRLLEVEPYPESTTTIQLQDYRIRLNVSKAE